MTSSRPNFVLIMADDHASHALSCYGSVINTTPQLDRIAQEGMRLDSCLCTNSICAPSRASILTGTFSHINGVTTLTSPYDNRQLTFPALLQQAGYQTALIGKWHLGHGPTSDPTGFDYWNVLPGQGDYHDPEFIDKNGRTRYRGYVTDIITDLTLDWLRGRDPDRPFLLCCHHKAPHRPWEPDPKHADLYHDIVPEPATFHDDYTNRSSAASKARMRVESDLKPRDLKQPVPEGLARDEVKAWKYQRYIKDYLRCVASIDDNVGRLLDYLDDARLVDNTVVVYTSDQGFFLGDHGWYDKRFMYEESLRMPFMVRYPREIKSGTTNDAIVTNVDFAPTFLDYAGLETPARMQGRSARPVFANNQPADWPESMYYRYWMHLTNHHVPAHYGIRTHRYKLIHYYGDALGQPGAITAPTEPEWELFDLDIDPREMRNAYHDPNYAGVVAELVDQLHRHQASIGDRPWPPTGPSS